VRFARARPFSPTDVTVVGAAGSRPITQSFMFCKAVASSGPGSHGRFATPSAPPSCKPARTHQKLE
jgi:hypothetical protein